MGLFGKTPERSPKEQVREWTSKLRKEGYQLDRQIRAIQRQEEGVKKSLKEAAKKNEKDVCLILAKEVIRARKAINRIHASKAQLNSVVMSMNHQLGKDNFSAPCLNVRDVNLAIAIVVTPIAATLRLAGSLQRSTEVMKSMQQLIKIPEVAQTMRDLSKEMMRAGIIEEMLEDTMEGLDDQEELEEEAQEEVDKVLWELTAGTLGKAPTAVTESLPSEDVEVAGPSTSLAEDEDDDVSKMQERLQALRS
uniref:Putative vacuolar sorting protein vps24 n=1 Tax=Ixodes ricinus TaxID=34613 RepID=A0A6B0V5S0_IXORI